MHCAPRIAARLLSRPRTWCGATPSPICIQTRPHLGPSLLVIPTLASPWAMVCSRSDSRRPECPGCDDCAATQGPADQSSLHRAKGALAGLTYRDLRRNTPSGRRSRLLGSSTIPTTPCDTQRTGTSSTRQKNGQRARMRGRRNHPLKAHRLILTSRPTASTLTSSRSAACTPLRSWRPYVKATHFRASPCWSTKLHRLCKNLACCCSPLKRRCQAPRASHRP